MFGVWRFKAEFIFWWICDTYQISKVLFMEGDIYRQWQLSRLHCISCLSSGCVFISPYMSNICWSWKILSLKFNLTSKLTLLFEFVGIFDKLFVIMSLQLFWQAHLERKKRKINLLIIHFQVNILKIVVFNYNIFYNIKV